VSRLIVGIQPVREAIRAHEAKLEQVLVEESDSPQLEAIARFAKDRGAKVIRVRRAELDRLTKNGRHQGVIAFAPELTIVSLDELDTGDGALIVVLDELEDPQNFGAILRSAVGLGATAVVWPEHHSAPLTPATFRASAGAVEHATLCRVGSLTSALADLIARGVKVVGLDSNAPALIEEVTFEGSSPVAIVIGAEGKGLRKSVKAACEELARLPMQSTIDSLNASVAAAIALYEVVRQRRVAARPT
jgi:23S rRNA (guanosine2251-2'-O)-methyltransferase